LHIGWGLCDRLCLVLVCRGKYGLGGVVLLNNLFWSVPSSRYMELGSYFLFLQEQTKDICVRVRPNRTLITARPPCVRVRPSRSQLSSRAPRAFVPSRTLVQSPVPAFEYNPAEHELQLDHPPSEYLPAAQSVQMVEGVAAAYLPDQRCSRCLMRNYPSRGLGRRPRHATTPEVKNHHRWIANGLALGPPRSTQVSISLITRTLPLTPEVGTKVPLLNFFESSSAKLWL
jgi:hypothetical protein